MSDAPPAKLLAKWRLQHAHVAPLAGGLINQTFLVEDGSSKWVLQRLHPVFGANVHLDIDAVTRHLAAKGLLTPRLLPTVDGALWVEQDSGIYRLQTFIEGRTLAQLTSPALAHAAGEAVGRFHAALSDLEHAFHFSRPGAHDTPRHLARLEQVLSDQVEHPLHAAVRPTAEAILSEGRLLIPEGPLPRRIIHGDLKCQNLRFALDRDEVVSLVDLDTLARETLSVEMGDALRSWCNPRGEDAPDAAVDEAIFDAAVTGYATTAKALLVDDERDALVPGFARIALELSARFCVDALEERYFGWDMQRYGRRGEHNLARARGQLSLARSVRSARTRLERRVVSAFR